MRLLGRLLVAAAVAVAVAAALVDKQLVLLLDFANLRPSWTWKIMLRRNPMTCFICE